MPATDPQILKDALDLAGRGGKVAYVWENLKGGNRVLLDKAPLPAGDEAWALTDLVYPSGIRWKP